MNYAQERHIDAIEDAGAELLRRIRAACAGKKGLPGAIDSIRKAVGEAKQAVLAEE